MQREFLVGSRLYETERCVSSGRLECGLTSKVGVGIERRESLRRVRSSFPLVKWIVYRLNTHPNNPIVRFSKSLPAGDEVDCSTGIRRKCLRYTLKTLGMLALAKPGHIYERRCIMFKRSLRLSVVKDQPDVDAPPVDISRVADEVTRSAVILMTCYFSMDIIRRTFVYIVSSKI